MIQAFLWYVHFLSHKGITLSLNHLIFLTLSSPHSLHKQHPYYLSPCVAPQFYLDQDHTDHIENKLLNDVFFSPAMLSPGKDDVSAFTEFSYERTSSICSSNSGSTTEDEDYNVQEDNLFLCDLDFETKEETFTSIKRSINNPTDDGTALASPLKRRKREKKADDR